MARLSGWHICRTESGKFYAAGVVYDSPKFDDGTDITTSNIKLINATSDKFVIYTKNSCYDAYFENFLQLEFLKDVFLEALAENGFDKVTAERIYRNAEQAAKKRMAG